MPARFRQSQDHVITQEKPKILIGETISGLYHVQVAHKTPWKSPQGKTLCEPFIANELYYTGHVSKQYSLQTAFYMPYTSTPKL